MYKCLPSIHFEMKLIKCRCSIVTITEILQQVASQFYWTNQIDRTSTCPQHFDFLTKFSMGISVELSLNVLNGIL